MIRELPINGLGAGGDTIARFLFELINSYTESYMAAIKAGGAVPGVQLGHAGRKAGTDKPWLGGKPLGLVPRHSGFDSLVVTG
jgi:hypothetical protein